jgi:hypothetical protein
VLLLLCNPLLLLYNVLLLLCNPLLFLYEHTNRCAIPCKDLNICMLDNL